MIRLKINIRESKIENRKLHIIALLILLVAGGWVLIYSKVVYATGGVYTQTKHGSTTSGVNRTSIDGNYSNYATGECAHCHEPHTSFGGSEPNPVTGVANDYLTFSGNTNGFCWTCHETFQFGTNPLGWGFFNFYQGDTIYLNSSHGNSANMEWPGLTGSTDDPIWPRMVDRNSIGNQAGLCLNCHTPHGISGTYDTGAVPIGVGAQAGLIPHQLIAREEALCENCHDANGPAGTDIQSEIGKSSSHTVDNTSLAAVHTVNETLPITSRHVECYDCHNPHTADNSNKVKGMRYIDINGTVNDPPTLGSRQPYEYEVCLKCHGNSYASIFPTTAYPGTTSSRPPGNSNKRKEFDPNSSDTIYGPPGTNSSYHPIAAQGLNQSSALNNQLLSAGLNTTSIIKCTDCHNNNLTSDTRGIASGSPSSPKGPHGSTNTSMLRANYSTAVGSGNSRPFNSFNASNFSLCFLCHDQTAFNSSSTNTNFYSNKNLHYFHLARSGVGGGGGGGGGNGTYASCHECHYNVHSNVEATNTEYSLSGGATNTFMVNFHPGMPGNSFSKPRWSYNGSTRTCNLRCHGTSHNKSYTP